MLLLMQLASTVTDADSDNTTAPPANSDVPEMDQRPLIFDTEAPVRIDDFDIDEIIAVLKKAKLNRAAGPDHIPVEFYE